MKKAELMLVITKSRLYNSLWPRAEIGRESRVNSGAGGEGPIAVTGSIRIEATSKCEQTFHSHFLDLSGKLTEREAEKVRKTQLINGNTSNKVENSHQAPR